jgi:hypothetical protein
MKKGIFETLLKITRIGNRAIKKTREENKRLGLPNVYSKNGKVIYEMPDGTITTKSPFKH